MLAMPIRNPGLLLAALFTCCASAADPSFTGTWKAEFRGTPYLMMTVAEGAPPRITMLTAHIHVNGDGEIDEVNGPLENENKVIEAKINNGRLRFKTRDEDGDEIEYEMQLTAEGAELFMLTAPIEVKPWRLQRS
jgi:hypothetical protein